MQGFYTNTTTFETAGLAPSRYNRSMNEAQRDQVIDRLSSDYANGLFEVEEYERRVAAAHAAQTPAELEALVPIGTTALVPAQKLRIIAGSIEKTGPWRVPQQLTTRVLWGNLLLDLREAVLSGNTTIDVHITMGNVEVIVPPGVDVEVDASSFMANVEERIDHVTTAGSRPVVRVIGKVRLGNLELATMRVGETRGDARRRRRAERRARRHWHRGMRSFGEW